MSDSSDRDRWRRLQELVADAIELNLEERTRFLQRACAGDVPLLNEAESLLKAFDQAHGSLTLTDPVEITHISPEAETEPETAVHLAPAVRVGPYVIREFIAAGSFGEIYLADRTSPIRTRVALKIVKRGMDTSQVLARFEAERQALALMNHSCIARIYDAGMTAAGRAYFAMEYVPGVSLTDHCDRHRLGINERLELFVRICEAVQHAHQKGVVHRDLKPSNILVMYEDDRAIPKIIDFGVAKALNQPLTERSIYTESGQIVGTLPYMSPEQADPTLQDIDTRSDIYSLGVLLFELLTGALPLNVREAGFNEARRLIRDVDPPKPSTKLTTAGTASRESLESARNRRLDVNTLTRRVRGDLDWITLKCLEKDRTRRYSSADGLAKEIQRHLRNEPLQETGPPSALYRSRKFVRRNRAAVVSAALIFVALLVGVVAVSISETKRRIVVRDNARYEARELVKHGRSLFYGHFYESEGGSESGRTLFREELEQTLATARAKDPELDEVEILMVHYLLLSGQREAAIDRAQEAARRHPGSDRLRAVLAGLRVDVDELGRLERVLRRDRWLYYRALSTADHAAAIELLEQSLVENPWFFDAKWQLAVRRYASGDDEGMLEEAVLLTRVEPDRAMVWDLKGTALVGLARYDDAAAAYSEAIARDERVWRGYYGRALARHRSRGYGEALNDLSLARERNPDSGTVYALQGAANAKLGDMEAAIEAYDRSIELGADDWWIYRDRADVKRVLKRRDEALQDLSDALERIPPALTDEIAVALVIRGDLLRDMRQMDKALADFERSLELNPNYTRTHFQLGRLHLLEHRYGEALRSFDEAVRQQPGQLWELGRGIAHWFAGNPEAALDDLRPLAEEYEWIHLWVWDIEASRGNDAGAAAALRAASAADSDDKLFGKMIDFLSGHAEASTVVPVAQNDTERLYAYYFLGSHARLNNRPQDAIAHYREAIELGVVTELDHDLAECQLWALVSEVH